MAISIASDDYMDLVAVNMQNELINISNKVLRKPVTLDLQEEILTDKSICIVCNYKFRDDPMEWSNKICAICHPFQDCEIFPSHLPQYNISESDFSDKLWLKVLTKQIKRYDFTFFTLDSRQGMKCKGFFFIPMFAKCADDAALKGTVVDYHHDPDNTDTYNQYHRRGSLGQALRKTRKHLATCESLRIIRDKRSAKSMARIIQRSRFIIFPNTADASPRLITESLVRGTPVIVNKRIYGGCKYINNNGITYTGPRNRNELEQNFSFYEKRIKRIIGHIVKDKKHDIYDPDKIQKQYHKTYGLLNSSKKLADVVNKIEGAEKYKFVFYPIFVPVFLDNHRIVHRDKREQEDNA